MTDTINWIKLTRPDGITLLRGYLYSHATEQRAAFKEDGHEAQVRIWTHRIEKILAAVAPEELVELFPEVTGSGMPPEYDVLDALCSYREIRYKHAERLFTMAGDNDDK